MKHKLPYPQVETIALFPKNLRFITEYEFSQMQTRRIKIIIVSVISLFLLTLIFVQGIALWYTFKEREILLQQRTRLQNEVNYWEQIANKYQGYRDVYYRIAAMQYKLGNTAESQKYIKKALDLDPNFPEGRVLGEKVGL